MSTRNEVEYKSKEKEKKYLKMLSEMSLSGVSGPIRQGPSPDGFCYVRVIEISNSWLNEERPLWQTAAKLFVGLFSANAPVSVVLRSNGEKTRVYVGTRYDAFSVLQAMLKGSFPLLRWEEEPRRQGDPQPRVYQYKEIGPVMPSGGYLKGNPTGSENVAAPFQIDSVINGMKGKAWDISLFAFPEDKAATLDRQAYWLGEATECSGLTEVSYTASDNAVEQVTQKTKYYFSEQYGAKVEAFCKKAEESVSLGEWRTVINFSAASAENARMLGGLLTAAFFGENAGPEPVHAVYCRSPFTPLADGFGDYYHTSFGEKRYPSFGTFLSSAELAVYAAFPTADTAGLTVRDYVGFDVNREAAGDLCVGRILDCGDVTRNPYSISVNELNRHCLIVGLTGSGKTNTVKSLICESTKGASRPFMVLEPAKKEYWELYKLGYDDLQIYSVGSGEADSHVFCLNPFERPYYTDPYGVRHTVAIQTHIDFVFAAFKASFIMYTPMPYVLERAIYEIYEDCGWDIHRNVNRTGEDVYPTVEDLYFKIPDVVTDMGYDQKMRNDLIGSLQARINSMRLGAKGDTLNVRRSFPLDRLLQGSVVVELEDIGDDDVKAFIISLLLIGLLEYRRQQEDCQQEVRHLMLIEEAHRLLKNVQSGTGENADPRGAAVEFFCNLLAELRSKGQGFIVADQIPSKLAPDLIKNTNLKIVHRTVAEEERRLIGGAMHMTEDQIDSLASLRQGVAAVYSEGDNRPKLVRPEYAGAYTAPGRENVRRETVLRAVAPNCISVGDDPDYVSLTDRMTTLCRRCNSHCRKRPEDVLKRCGDPAVFEPFAAALDPKKNGCDPADLDRRISDFVQDYLPGSPTAWTDRYCVLNCLLRRWALAPDAGNKLVSAYLSIKKPD